MLIKLFVICLAIGQASLMFGENPDADDTSLMNRVANLGPEQFDNFYYELRLGDISSVNLDTDEDAGKMQFNNKDHTDIATPHKY